MALLRTNSPPVPWGPHGPEQTFSQTQRKSDHGAAVCLFSESLNNCDENYSGGYKAWGFSKFRVASPSCSPPSMGVTKPKSGHLPSPRRRNSGHHAPSSCIVRRTGVARRLSIPRSGGQASPESFSRDLAWENNQQELVTHGLEEGRVWLAKEMSAIAAKRLEVKSLVESLVGQAKDLVDESEAEVVTPEDEAKRLQHEEAKAERIRQDELVSTQRLVEAEELLARRLDDLARLEKELVERKAADDERARLEKELAARKAADDERAKKELAVSAKKDEAERLLQLEQEVARRVVREIQLQEEEARYLAERAQVLRVAQESQKILAPRIDQHVDVPAKKTGGLHKFARQVKQQAAELKVHSANFVKSSKFQVTAVSAAAGGVTVGTSGAVVGCATGGAIGAVVGIIPAPFTFGLSIPFFAAMGGGAGLCIGATAGGTVGALGGGTTGYHIHAYRTQAKAENDCPELAHPPQGDDWAMVPFSQPLDSSSAKTSAGPHVKA